MVAADETDQRRVVRVGVERGLPTRQRVEQASQLRVGQPPWQGRLDGGPRIAAGAVSRVLKRRREGSGGWEAGPLREEADASAEPARSSVDA